MSLPRRIAVLGGTLDPVHIGHVSVLDQVVALLDAVEGWLVPSNTPPHRPAALVNAATRLRMARTAVSGRERLRVDASEVERGGPSYTIDSVEAWSRAQPDTEFHIVLGADAARLMPQWHRAADLLGCGHFVISNRSGVERVDVPEAAALGFPPDRTRLLNVVSPPVSATEIRRRLAAGEGVDGMLDPGVKAIIERERLYMAAA